MRRRVLRAVLFGFVGAVLWQQGAVAQTVHYVDNIRTCDGLTPCYSAIMDAVNAAASFDTIEVFPGVYHEAVVFSGKDHIALKAHDEALPPVIAAPPGGLDAVAITASPGIQVLRFVLEAPKAAGVALDGGGSSATVIQGNLVKALSGVTLGASVSCTARDNTVLGGGISLPSGNDCLIERNTLDSAGIVIGGSSSGVKRTVIQQNVVRGGGIGLSGKNVRDNTVGSNFVSASPGDGISVETVNGSTANVIQDNTSIENAACDINDSSSGGGNTWTNNRFGTKCGAATE